MNPGISKKVIFFSFLFINFIQPSKTVEIQKIIKSENYPIKKLNRSKTPYKKVLSNSSNFSLNKFELNSFDKKFLKEHSDSLLAFSSENQKEIIIKSDKQSELNDVIYAEGNVSVSYKGKLLKADNLVYDR